MHSQDTDLKPSSVGQSPHNKIPPVLCWFIYSPWGKVPLQISRTHWKKNRFKITYFGRKTWSFGSAGDFWNSQEKCFQIPTWHSGMPDCHVDISMNILILAWMHFNSRKFGQGTFQEPEDKNHNKCKEKYILVNQKHLLTVKNTWIYEIPFTRFAAPIKFAVSKTRLS